MIYESQLYHHGIKNQKWGKRNGPPYPLDRKSKSKRKIGENTKTGKKYIELKNRKDRLESEKKQINEMASKMTDYGANWPETDKQTKKFESDLIKEAQKKFGNREAVDDWLYGTGATMQAKQDLDDFMKKQNKKSLAVMCGGTIAVGVGIGVIKGLYGRLAG